MATTKGLEVRVWVLRNVEEDGEGGSATGMVAEQRERGGGHTGARWTS
jgi:hypothetical protein